MNEVLPKCNQKMSEASSSVTGLQESLFGHMPCDSPDGPTIEKYGPAPAPVPASQRQAKAEGLATLVTSGLIGSGSSASAALQRSLVSRLRQRFNLDGLTLWQLTWSQPITPLGRPYFRLRASARRTSGTGFGSWLESWPSPNVYDSAGGGSITVAERKAAGLARPSGSAYASQLRHSAQLASWPTPDADTSGSEQTNRGQGTRLKLLGAARICGWPTPNTLDTVDRPNGLRPSRIATNRESGYLTEIAPLTDLTSPPVPTNPDAFTSEMDGMRASTMPDSQTSDGKSQRTMPLTGWTTPQAHDTTARGSGQKAKHGTKHGCADLNHDAALASWATPRSEDSECTGAHRGTADTLHSQANLSSWASPSARDWKDTTGMAEMGTNPDGSERTRLDQLPRQAGLTTGATPSGYPAGTGSGAPFHGWATPKATDGSGGRTTETEGGGNAHLDKQAKMAGWPTPMAGSPATENYNEAGNTDSGRKTVELVENSGFHGQLNPALSRALMSLPEIWDTCALRASEQLRRSSKRGKRG